METDLNIAWNYFITSILSILDNICPLRKSRYTNSRPAWITNELMELANDRDKALKLAKRDPLPVNIMQAKTLRNEAKIAFKLVREEYIKSKLEEFKDDPKKFWNELNNVIPVNKCKTNDIFNLVDGNSEALSNDVTSTYVNNYFSTIGSSLAAEIGNINQNDINFLREHQPRDFSGLEQFTLDSFTLEEVQREIKNINIYKSSGINNISSRILKDIWLINPNLLLNILNKAIHSGTFPKAWKHGTVIPIPKVPNPQQVNDLRPITLLPLPGKIMERLIHNKLYPYLEENNILSSKQNGFRKQHGTPDTIFKLLTHIIDNINKKKITIAVFIDFKKAFDTLDHLILQQKLSSLNLSPNILKWFESYLTGRSQMTYMNTCTSPVANLTHGVPQGSILGPLLFNLYINGLPNVIRSNMILYADDSVVFASANSLYETCQVIQSDLKGVGIWCKHHKLSINTNKTKAMLFGTQEMENVPNINIKISNNQIEFVKSYKYLGIHLDSKMLFNYQFNETYRLASYKLLLLKRVRPVITEFTALTVVKSMLLPYLDMGNLFLSSQTLNDLNKLDLILNTALRIVYKVYIPRDVHMLELYTKANIFPLKYRRKYFMLNLVHRLLTTGQIEKNEAQRITRHNMAPVLPQYVPKNDIVAKSPVFIARSCWNNLPVNTRNIEDHDQFKTVTRNMIQNEYTKDENTRLTAGLFNVL